MICVVYRDVSYVFLLVLIHSLFPVADACLSYAPLHFFCKTFENDEVGDFFSPDALLDMMKSLKA